MTPDWSAWQWDETLFAGSARYYERGRLPYAPGIAAVFRSALQLDGTGRLLDVGCGPGTITVALANLFEAVIGLDPDAAMLDEAARAAERSVTNATWAHLRAEQLPGGLGAFRAITFAASFHWMDRPVVAAAVRRMLTPDGVVVHVDNRHQDRLRPARAGPLPPKDDIDAMRARYLGNDRRAGQSIRNSSPDDEDDVWRAAGFAGPELVIVADGRTIIRTVDDIVAETFSMSSTAPHLFDDRLAEFEADLREMLEDAASNDGTFSVVLPDNELKLWRPARHSVDS